MTRTTIPDDEAEAINRRTNGPEGRRQIRRKADMDAATWPASGAPVHHARVAAELAGEDNESETAQAIKRAAENDGRV
jgi:hypothetical protein